MPISIKMPALSPTMEEGTLAKWLIKVGDKVASGDIMAEIETDKATMEFEAVDEGIVTAISVSEGTEGVKVGTVIATLAEEGEDASVAAAPAAAPKAEAPPPTPARAEPVEPKATEGQPPSSSSPQAPASEGKSGPSTSSGQSGNGASPASGDRVIASPLAKRIAAAKGIDLSTITGTGPGGRIVKADVDGATPGAASDKLATTTTAVAPPSAAAASSPAPALAARGIKLSVNDLLIKALGSALVQVPKCNVAFAGDTMRQYHRADISVAVSIPGGLITPIITDAGSKSASAISTEMAALAAKAKDGKLQPHEFQGGTASLSNMGMMGIKQFEAVINPPQGMIMAIGAGEQRPYVVDGALAIATVMSVTGSFDHRAIDGADGAQLMQAFKALVEAPLGLVA